MGTRHVICIFWEGKWYLAQYGQFDGYPEGQGVRLFKFLSVARNIDNLKEGLKHHVYEPTRDELDAIWAECEEWDDARRADPATFNVWERNMYGVNQLYPSLARETSANVLGLIARAARPEEPAEDDEETGSSTAATQPKTPTERKKIPLQLDLDFATDSLFCEWAYVVDLDQEVLEVYGGHEAKHDGHRFKDVGEADAAVPRFVCSYTFAELFLTTNKGEFLEKLLEAHRELVGDPEEGWEPIEGGPTCTGVPTGDDAGEEEEGGEGGDEEEGKEDTNKDAGEDADEDEVAHETDVDEGSDAKGSS